MIVKHSTTLTVVTGVELMVVWVSLTIVTQLFGWDTTEFFYSLWGKQLTVTVEDEDEITVGIKPMYTDKTFTYTYRYIRKHICTEMWLELWKPTKLWHFVFWEIPLWNIEATVVFLCFIVAMPHLLYK